MLLKSNIIFSFEILGNGNQQQFIHFTIFYTKIQHIFKSENYKRNWGMRMEVWLWCRCECWVLMNGSSEQITHQCYGNTTMGIWTTNQPGMFYSDPLQISIVKWLLDNNWTLPVGESCVQCPPGAQCWLHWSWDKIIPVMRQRRHLQSKEAMGQIWNWTEECLWVRVACRRKLPS